MFRSRPPVFCVLAASVPLWASLGHGQEVEPPAAIPPLVETGEDPGAGIVTPPISAGSPAPTAVSAVEAADAGQAEIASPPPAPPVSPEPEILPPTPAPEEPPAAPTSPAEILTDQGPDGQQHRDAVVAGRNAVGAQELGWAYFEKGQWTVSRQWFERALEYDPGQSRAAEGLIMTAYRSGQPKAAYELAVTHQALVPEGRSIVAKASATTAARLAESGNLDQAEAMISEFPASETAFDEVRQAIAARRLESAVARKEFGEARAIARENQIDPARVSRDEAAEWLQKAADARGAGKHRDSLQYIAEAEKIAPLERTGRQIKAWSLYQNREFDESAKLFEDLYRDGHDRDSAEGLTHSLQQAGRVDDLARLNRELGGPLATSSDPVLIAAARAEEERKRQERERERQMLASAATISPAESVPSLEPAMAGGSGFGSVIAAAAAPHRSGEAIDLRPRPVPETPRLAAGGGYRVVSRDGGIDRLRVTHLPSAESTMVFGPGGNQSVTFGVRALSLESGSLRGRLVGAAESTLEPRPLVTETDTLIEPRLAYRLENGDRAYFAEIGSTPIGAEIGARAVGALGVEYHGDTVSAGLQGFSESVNESLLSYTGMRDPYTGKDWGRVVRTGVRADGVVELGGGWAASGLFEYSLLDGENVADNSAVAANLGLTYQLDVPGFEYVAVGPTFHFESYEKNLGGFTSGHGGYFSPDQLFQGMLGLSFLTETGGAWLAEGFVGVGAQTNDQSASPVLPLAPDGRFYDASSESSAIFTARLQALFELNPQWRLGAQAGYAKTAAYDDFAVSVYLSFLFDREKRGLDQSDLAR